MHAPRRFAMVRGVRLDRWVGSVIDCVDTMRELWGCVAGDLPRAQRGGKLTDGPVHDFGNVGLQRAGEGNDRTEGGGGCEEGTGSRQACGRPRRIFRRDETARLREDGKSWAAIGRILLGVPAGTVREGVRKPPWNRRRKSGQRQACRWLARSEEHT